MGEIPAICKLVEGAYEGLSLEKASVIMPN